MPIRYDPGKATANLRKHGVSFAAVGVLFDPLAVTIEDREVTGELRFATIGLGTCGDLLVVIHAEQGVDRRLISARRATRKERKTYEG